MSRKKTKTKQIQRGKKIPCLTIEAEKVIDSGLDKIFTKLASMKSVEYVEVYPEDDIYEPEGYQIVPLNTDTAFREEFLEQMEDLLIEKLYRYTK